MSGPPPYRPRPKEGEEDKEEKLTEQQLEDRNHLIQVLLVAMGVGAYAGLALLTRELPGGSLPYVFPLSKVPSVAFWLVAIVFAFRWSGRRPRLVALVSALTLLASLSLLGAALAYHADPAAWKATLAERLG